MKSVAADWVASYRLQLHAGFDFGDARLQLPYLKRLGISHLYLSPILKARAGSMHGYDVVDHALVNPELGGEAGFQALVAEARALGLGIVVDIVPNHMAVGGGDNALWLDLLEWGPRSRAARFFDVDWDVQDLELNGKVLLPFLADCYGESLQKGALKLHHDPAQGRFHFEHFEHRFPLAARLYAPLLRAGGKELAAWASRFRAASSATRFQAVCQELAADGQQDVIREAVAELLASYEPATPKGREHLHRLLMRQHYRLCSWRNATDEINWRRFFDVSTLAGLKVEEPAVFETVHATLFRLYAEGLIDGFRVDHVDGLSDPRAYCLALRKRLRKLQTLRPDTAPRGEAYVVLEKILAPQERLSRDWAVDGTTGYSFMNEAGALAHDPRGEQPLYELWNEQTGRRGDFDAEVLVARRRIPQELLAADFNACAHAFHRLARADVATRDWTLAAIRRVLIEVLVQLPIYRTYIDAKGRSEADTAVLQQVFASAGQHCRSSEVPLLEVFDGWLGGKASVPDSPALRRLRLRAIARFQQLSSPVAAKSVEDTAFYRYGLLLSRNEVGADPRQFSLSPEAFHIEAQGRAEAFPYAMLATATHDHKRGEDARMRLALLSEAPDAWIASVRQWRLRHEPLKPGVGEVRGPDAADELMLYQTLFAIWPVGLRQDDAETLKALEERVRGWQQKSIREAKRHSGWLEPNEPYEAASHEFLSMLLAANSQFVQEMSTLANRMAAAATLKSLAQVLLKLTAPGLPDFYQGTELWDFSMVDPDNRRPVDFALRAGLLDGSAGDAECLERWQDGAVKQRLIARILGARQAAPQLFTEGAYTPLRVSVAADRRYLAFAREWNGMRAVVVLPLSGAHGLDQPGLSAANGGTLDIELPAGWPNRIRFSTVLSQTELLGDHRRLSAPLKDWPCELFIGTGETARR